MVKGLSRQVIIVDSPDPNLFEQAIFIVRKETGNRSGVTQEQLLSEACRVAQGYCRTHQMQGRSHTVKKLWIWGVAGVGGIALGWLFCLMTAV